MGKHGPFHAQQSMPAAEIFLAITSKLDGSTHQQSRFVRSSSPASRRWKKRSCVPSNGNNHFRLSWQQSQLSPKMLPKSINVSDICYTVVVRSDVVCLLALDDDVGTRARGHKRRSARQNWREAASYPYRPLSFDSPPSSFPSPRLSLDLCFSDVVPRSHHARRNASI